MNIVYHHRTRSRDGQAVHVEELIAALRQCGHEIIVVGPARTKDEEFGGESSTLAWMRRHCPRILYELLEFGYCLIDFARLLSGVYRAGADVIYERFNLFLPSGIWVSRIMSVPLLLEVNAPLYQERTQYGGIALHRLARWSQEYAWRGATRCLPVTHVLERYLVQAGVCKTNITVIPNGVNTSTFSTESVDSDFRQQLSKKYHGSLVLGFVGFVRSWHGLDKVLELVADQTLVDETLTFIVIGDGPAKSPLIKQSVALGIEDRVVFTGTLPRDRVKSYIALFDIALQPMVVSYASPLKLFEYMAMGRAIVAPNVSNIREVLVNEHNALLFDPLEQDSMKNAVSRLIRDPDLRGRIGRSAKETIRSQGFTWNQNAKRVTQLMESLVPSDSAPRRHGEQL